MLHLCQSIREQELRFIEVVVLVVLRSLQRQLERQPLLRDLVYPYPWLYHRRTGIRSSRLLGLGCSVSLSCSRPARIEKIRESLVCFECKHHSIVFYPHSKACARRDHLHEGVLFGLRIDGHSGSTCRT